MSGEVPAVLKIDVISLFPETIMSALSASIPARALERGLATLTCHDLRTWGIGKHRSVDDEPYGGGAGMLLRPEPRVDAIDVLRGPDSTVILFDAGGERLRQPRVRALAAASHLIIICGRYEGVDQRVVDHMIDEEISVGPYVLAGGELGALTIIEAVSRLVPGVLGNAESLTDETFNSVKAHKGKSKREVQDIEVEYPQYTKPADFKGWKVPDVLLSGDHKKIKEWKQSQIDKKK